MIEYDNIYFKKKNKSTNFENTPKTCLWKGMKSRTLKLNFGRI